MVAGALDVEAELPVVAVDVVEAPLEAGVDAGVAVELEVDVDVVPDAPSLFDSFFEELYKSAYQPPPFKMKPAPPDTWRFAESWPQPGHVFSGAALIDCSASQ